MRSTFRMFTAAAFASTLVGCAGTDFVRPAVDSFTNGQTTHAQVVQQMGPPRREGTLTRNDKVVKTIVYAYASHGQALHEGVIPARAQGFYFYNDTLVGHEFVSSFAVDHTDFDEKKISNIGKGKTCQSELTQLFGKPSGYYIHPLIKAQTGNAAVYLFQETSGSAFTGLKLFRKILIVSFETGGIVSDIDFSSSGSK